MKPLGNKPLDFVIKVGGGTLSRSALIELLQAVLDRGRSFRFQAQGFSMIPFIQDGDVITVSRIPDGFSYFGNVVVFIHLEYGRIVVHRVVGKKSNSFLLRGDNHLNTDGFVPGENLLGYVKKIERNGKAVLFGLGPERFLIAFLSRMGLLNPLAILYKKILTHS